MAMPPKPNTFRYCSTLYHMHPNGADSRRNTEWTIHHRRQSSEQSSNERKKRPGRSPVPAVSWKMHQDVPRNNSQCMSFRADGSFRSSMLKFQQGLQRNVQENWNRDVAQQIRVEGVSARVAGLTLLWFQDYTLLIFGILHFTLYWVVR